MEQKRFVGIDLGKRTYEIKFIHSNGKVTGTNGLTSPKGRKELYKKLNQTDRVAIEVCSLAMVMVKEIRKEVGCEVVLLNPSQIALIYRSVKKNDKEDALKLARLVQKFSNEELPSVELPSEHEENLRQILTEMRQLKHDRTKEINRMHVIFLESGITEITKKDLDNNNNRKELSYISIKINSLSWKYFFNFETIKCKLLFIKALIIFSSFGLISILHILGVNRININQLYINQKNLSKYFFYDKLVK